MSARQNHGCSYAAIYFCLLVPAVLAIIAMWRFW